MTKEEMIVFGLMIVIGASVVGICKSKYVDHFVKWLACGFAGAFIGLFPPLIVGGILDADFNVMIWLASSIISAIYLGQNTEIVNSNERF